MGTSYINTADINDKAKCLQSSILTILIRFSKYRTLSQSEFQWQINMGARPLNQLKLCLLLGYICHNLNLGVEETDRVRERVREGEWRSERQFCKVSHYAAVGERMLWLGFQYLRCAKGATERDRK